MGFSETLASGYYVSYFYWTTACNWSVSLDNNVVVSQGFQHPLDLTICYEDCNQNIKTIYPNPFIDTVNLKFSEKINEEITISIYDILGRIL
jgi:hypothetical protein